MENSKLKEKRTYLRAKSNDIYIHVKVHKGQIRKVIHRYGIAKTDKKAFNNTSIYDHTMEGDEIE